MEKGKQKERGANNKRFTIVFQRYGREIDRKVSEKTLALLAVLIHRMDFDTNIVVDDAFQRMSLNDLSDTMSWTKKKTLQILNELIDLGIIHKCKRGVYTYYIMDYKYAVCGNVDAIIKFLQESLTNGND